MIFKHILSIAIFFPIFLGIILLFIRNNIFINLSVCFFNCTIFLLNIYLLYNYNNSIKIQYCEYIKIIPKLNINYYIGIDGISLIFISILSLSTIITSLYSLNRTSDKSNIYYSLIFCFYGSLIGIFSSINTILLYYFLECSILITYLNILIFGKSNKINTAKIFFIFSNISSLLLLVIIFILNNFCCVSQLNKYTINNIPQNIQYFIYFLFILFIFIKLPLFPFHTWYVNTINSLPKNCGIIPIMLSTKVGCYLLIKMFFIFSNFFQNYYAIFVIVIIFNILYFSFMNINIKNYKKIVTYGSISHTGYVFLGLLFLYHPLLKNFYKILFIGILFQSTIFSFNNIINILVIDFFRNIKTTSSNINKKNTIVISSLFPIITISFLVSCFSNIGIPGTGGFIGEFLIILALSKYSILFIILFVINILFNTTYTCIFYKNLFLQFIVSNNFSKKFYNKNYFLEKFCILISAVCSIYIGCYPNIIIQTLGKNILFLMKK